MDIDRGLALAVLIEGLKSFHDSDVTIDMLEGGGREAVAFMDKYWRQHGKMPTKEALIYETGVDFRELPIEPLTFWSEEIKKRHTFNEMRESLDPVIEKLDKADPFAALEAFRREFFRLENLLKSSSGVEPVFDDIDSIIEEHDRASLGITGVPTPYSALNELTQGWQPEDLIVIAGRPGQGKCLGAGTLVLMADGTTKKVEDIVVGDKVMGPDSGPRLVVSLARGREEMFEVKPVKGEPWTCNRSHILSLRMSSDNGSRYKAGDIVNLTIDEFLSRNAKFRHHAKLWRTGVEYPSRSVPFDPYFIGLWIGDGTWCRPEITTGDPEIEEYIYRFAASIGLLVTTPKPGNGCLTFCVSGSGGWNPLSKYLRDHCLEADKAKRVPGIYLVNDRKTRLALLAGWIDADGHLFDGCCEILVKSETLRDQLLALARGLGFAAYVKRKRATIKATGFVGYYWRVRISGDLSEIPVILPRKKALPRRQKKSVLSTGFSLRSLGEGDYYGFELSGPDRLFLLADHTVTHNTFLLLIFGLHPWQMRRDKVLIVSTEMSQKAIRRRCAALVTRTSYSKIKQGKLTSSEITALRTGLEKIKGDPNLIMMGKNMRVDLESIHAQAMIHKPKLLCIDGFYLLKSSRIKGYTKKNERVADMLDMTKEMAKDLGIPVMITTQMNRPPAERSNRAKPDLERLAFSDNMGMIADYVFFLDRSQKDRESGELRITPAKVRESEFIGSIISAWDFDKGDFSQRRVDDGSKKDIAPLSDADVPLVGGDGDIDFSSVLEGDMPPPPDVPF